MALLPCTECKKDVSDRASSCPHCGMPLGPKLRRRKRRRIVGGVLLLAVLACAGLYATRREHRLNYAKVDELRAEQEDLGTHNDETQQRFFRLYKEHPNDAGYIYLWARCVDDDAKQFDLAQEGIRVDPRFSWNYNLVSRGLARQNKISEAYDAAVKGGDLDSANLPLADKREVLKLMLDHKVDSRAKPGPSEAAVHYKGVSQGPIKSPERADLEAIERSRLSTYKGPVSEVVKGFTVCANRYADGCIRAYVPVDARFEPAWQHSATDVAGLKNNRIVALAGSVVTNNRGDNIMLADSVTVETP